MSPQSFRVLVFSKTAGFRHASIQAAIDMFRRLAQASMTTAAGTGGPFEVETSEDADACFTAEHLAQFRVLVLLQTTGDFLDAAQLAALQAYVRSGRGGVVGIHAASAGMRSDAVDGDGWYSRLLGARLADHPAPQLGRLVVKDPAHAAVLPLLAQVSASEATLAEPSYSWYDEWYNFADGSSAVVAALSPSMPASPASPTDLHVLLAVDETTYSGGKHSKGHPIAWCRLDFENTGTRVFYTALGHYDTAYEDELFVQHLQSAVLWTAKIV